MIEDNFDILGHNNDIDNPVVKMRCCRCNFGFDAHMGLVTPKNCRHLLGKSITVVCPACELEGTTASGEALTDELTNDIDTVRADAIAELRQKREEFLSKVVHDDQKFVPLNKADMQTGECRMGCNTCGHEFDVGMLRSHNAVVGNGEVTITCPKCTTVERIDKARAAIRLLNSMYMWAAHLVEEEIAQLETGNAKAI